MGYPSSFKLLRKKKITAGGKISRINLSNFIVKESDRIRGEITRFNKGKITRRAIN